MQGLSLTEAPATLSTEGERLWLDGLPAPVAQGDLWLLSWDNQALGLVVIRRTRDDYIVGWPATLPGDPSFFPALLVEQAGLGCTVTIWPQAATGIGRHLLHRRLGNLLSPRTVDLVEEAARGQGEPPVGSAPRSDDEDGKARLGAELLSHYEAICFHQWPGLAIGEATLNLTYIESRGLGAHSVSAILGTTAPDTLALLRQQRPPTSGEVTRLAAAWGAPPADFLAPQHSEAVAELLDPGYKDDLLRIVLQRGLSEARARSLVQREFDLAARTDKRAGSRSTRMRAAISRLLQAPDESPEAH
jgi:hypothetical protein